MRAGGLPFVAGRHFQHKPLVSADRRWIDLRVEFQELLIDAAELFAPQISVVDRPPAVFVGDEREATDGCQNRLIGKRRSAQWADRLLRPKIAAERHDPQLRAVVRPAE